jgi:hypothetical protein
MISIVNAEVAASGLRTTSKRNERRSTICLVESDISK